jgi:hypothetical protein
MKVRCYKCGKEASAAEDNLIDMGWAGAMGMYNSKHYNVAVCPDHAKEFVKEFPALLKAGCPETKGVSGKELEE